MRNEKIKFSNFYTDDVDDNNVLTGFNAGLLLKCLFPKTFLQTEISYRKRS
jgi:hypothetical protein